MSEELRKYLGKDVILDTDSRWLYIGVLKEVGRNYFVLEEVDAHDLSETTSTREEYILTVKRDGKVVNRKRQIVRKEVVVGISFLNDVQ